jgi:predicted RecA/RadA family phage recombinase
MAKNRVYEDGEQLSVPVIAGTVSGSPVIVGMLPGVALTTRDSNGNSTCQLGDGVFNVSVTGAIASVGLPVYITSATYALVVAPGAGIQLFGHAMATKGAGAGTIPVRIAHYAVASDAPA